MHKLVLELGEIQYPHVQFRGLDLPQTKTCNKATCVTVQAARATFFFQAT